MGVVTANRIFSNHKMFRIRQDYAEAVSSLGKIATFKNVTAAVIRINLWVKNETHGKISEIVENKDVEEKTAAVLLSAAYFRIPWKYQFKLNDTTKQTFHVTEKTSVQVDMMQVVSTFAYADLPEVNASAIFLPYKV